MRRHHLHEPGWTDVLACLRADLCSESVEPLPDREPAIGLLLGGDEEPWRGLVNALLIQHGLMGGWRFVSASVIDELPQKLRAQAVPYFQHIVVFFDPNHPPRLPRDLDLGCDHDQVLFVTIGDLPALERYSFCSALKFEASSLLLLPESSLYGYRGRDPSVIERLKSRLASFRGMFRSSEMVSPLTVWPKMGNAFVIAQPRLLHDLIWWAERLTYRELIESLIALHGPGSFDAIKPWLRFYKALGILDTTPPPPGEAGEPVYRWRSLRASPYFKYPQFETQCLAPWRLRQVKAGWRTPDVRAP